MNYKINKKIDTTELLSLISSSSISKICRLMDRAELISAYQIDLVQKENEGGYYDEVAAHDDEVKSLLDELYPDQNYDEVMSYLKENNLSALLVGELQDDDYEPKEITALAVITRWFVDSRWHCLGDLYGWYQKLIKRELFSLPSLKEGDDNE